MKINDGGPAFPRPLSQFGDEEYSGDQDGMSLRDWFAGQALAGVLAHGWRHGSEAVDAAFVYADAMLEARKGGAQ